MAKNLNLEFTKTYANIANAEKAVAKLLGADHAEKFDELRYIIVPIVAECSVRYGVLFLGNSSIAAGMHFHFNCAN